MGRDHMRVLHVSDVMGGGVLSAVLAMVEATPELDHHLLARSRAGHDTGADPRELFGSVHLLPTNPVAAIVELRRRCRDLFPDVVHAHSSAAGVIARLAGLDAPVVYSPHCFAFERKDLSRRQRGLVAMVERRLASRTDLLVAVSPAELDLGAELGHRHVAYTPNRAAVVGWPIARYRAPMHIVAAGRIVRQKDWHYFLHVKRYAERELGVEATWEWLGGGSRSDEQELERAGVTVSGWVERDQLLSRMSRAQLFLHTAAWEAAPISILEAAALGVPLVVRGIGSLRSLCVPGIGDSATELAEQIRNLAAAQPWRMAQQRSLALAQRCSRENQARRLLDAYARVCPDQRVEPIGTAFVPSPVVVSSIRGEDIRHG